jgi:acetyl-CoA carboxylase biotin carboxylase subunit
VSNQRFKKILIANRGEIAVRIIRACREMGVSPVVIFSDIDRTAMHVRLADEAYPLGGTTPAESYLSQDKIIEIARRSRVDAIHPGYGFLSENPAFSALAEESGIRFIGPSASSIRSVGDKTSARRLAEQLGIPIVPGTKEPLGNEEGALKSAEEIGFPVLLKAAAGGGGKGMRIVHERETFLNALRMARSEAKSAFGDDRIYLEKYIEAPRHIEIQIFADELGNTVYLGERECSIQRRHQKVIEETPSVIVTDSLREDMGKAATKLVRSVGYVNAGTVEFLVDQHRKFYFLEVNTRLQVEHPVTELVTGIDLVREQIRVAEGNPLSFSQDEITRRGHAIECRICAEDPGDNFFPSVGRLTAYFPPQGPKVRVDNGVSVGDEITIYYDPLMAKVITWGHNRIEAIESMRRALNEFSIDGVRSTIPFCASVLDNQHFREGEFDTTFVEREFDPAKLYQIEPSQEVAAAVAAVLLRTGARSGEPNPTNHFNGQGSLWKKLRQNSHN